MKFTVSGFVSYLEFFVVVFLFLDIIRGFFKNQNSNPKTK